MEKFAIGVSIGAAVTSSFHSILSTSEDKVQALSASVKDLGKQKIALDEVKSYRAELAHLTASIKPGTMASTDLKAKIDTVRVSLKKAQTAARALGVDTRRLGIEEKRLAADLKASNRALKARTTLTANKAKRQQLHSEFMGAAASLGAVVVPVRAAVSFESSMADVAKVVDIKEPGGIKVLGKDILDLSKKIPMAADGIASIVEAAGQSGMAKTRKELVAFASTTATMGVAFDLSGNDAGEMMTAWRAGMKLTQNQAVSLADAVNHLSNKMNAKAGPLGEVLQRQGAVAVSAGLTEIQAASLGAALLSSGKGPEIAATAMKNLTGALTRGAAATGAQKKAFRSLGLDAVEMASMMQKDAVGAIKQVFTALSEASPEERSSLVSQVFGEESKGAIMPLLTNLDNLEKAFALTADKTGYAGSMQKEYEVRSKTTAFNLQRLRNQVTKVGVNLGTTLLPALNASLGPIGALADGVGKFAETFPGVSTAITMGTAAFLLAKPAMFAVRYGITAVTDVVAMSKLAWGFLTTQLSFASIQARALRAAQLGTAAGAKIAAGAQWLWNTSLSAGSFILAKARVIALGAAQAGVAVGTKVLAAAQIALGAAMNIALGPVGLIIGAVSALSGLAVLVWKNWEPVKGFFAVVWQSVATGAVNLWSALKTGIKASFWIIKTAFLNFTPLGWIIKGFTAVKNYLATVDWSSPGKAIMGTLVAGIKAVALGPVEAVKGVFTKVRKFLPFSDAKEGPLSTLTAAGTSLVTTFAKGMESGKKGLTKKAATVAAAAGIVFAPRLATADHGGDVPVIAAVPPSVPADSQLDHAGNFSGRGLVINYNPVIHVNPGGGQAEVIRQNTKKALDMSQDRFRQMMKDLLDQDRRLSYV